MTLFDPDAEGPSGPSTTAPPVEGGAGRAGGPDGPGGRATPLPAPPAPARRRPKAAVGQGTGDADAPSGAAAPARRRRTPELGPVPEVTVRLRLDVAYDGAGFRGFAAQQGQRTVAGVLADAIATVVRHPVTLTCAGRTDTGVHAQGQVVHVDVVPGTDPDRLVRSVNAMVGPEVAVRAAAEADGVFDARRGARARTYRYLVHEADAPDPWWRDRVWTVPGPLDLRGMAAGADALLGEHDFRSFCRRPPDLGPEDPIVRRVLDARWSEVDPDTAMVAWGRLLRFDVTATSFCHQMVRSVVGLLVVVGQGRQRAADVHWALQRGDRAAMPDPAPPGGLTLVRVDY